MPLVSDLIRVVAQALTCPTLTREEVRFLHTLHLKLLAGLAPTSDSEIERVLLIISVHAIRIPPKEE